MMEYNDMKAGNVTQQLGRLRNTIESLSSVSSALVQKINPVLLEPLPELGGCAESPTAPYQPLSPLYEDLRVLEHEVEGVISNLDAVIRRVDL
jgi:hypothetical protein